MTAGRDLRERHEALVREHMESENHHDFELTLGTFGHPRYEIVPTGDVFDGEDAVRRYFDAATILSQLGLVQPAPSLVTTGADNR